MGNNASRAARSYPKPHSVPKVTDAQKAPTIDPYISPPAAAVVPPPKTDIPTWMEKLRHQVILDEQEIAQPPQENEQHVQEPTSTGATSPPSSSSSASDEIDRRVRGDFGKDFLQNLGGMTQVVTESAQAGVLPQVSNF